MKYFKKYRISIITIALLTMVMGCMTIENIIHPDDPQVNSEIEIGVDLKLVPDNDDNTQMVFAVLAPKSWKIAENAKLTFSTNGYTQGDILNETMVLMSNTDIEPTTALPWSAALQSEIGLMENLGPVEWVVFRSQTTFVITDEVEKLINAHVKIKLTTGSENIKLFMGYFFTGKTRGLHSEYYEKNAKSKVMTVSGGSNALIDYTTVSLVTTVPSNFGYNDLFSIVFQSQAGAVETPLKGEDEVYIYGKAIFAEGKDSIIVDGISDKTLMERIGNTTYQKYIYAPEFFGLPEGAVLTETYFHFSNGTQDIIVTQPSGEDFLISEACDN